MTALTTPRAVEILSEVPEGCRLVLITGDYAAPHILPGEFVVVDPSDKEPAIGEPLVRALRQRDGRVNHQVFVLRPVPETMRRSLPQDGETYVNIGPMLPTTLEDVEAHCRGAAVKLRMSDGPISLTNVADDVLGRVVGVYMAPEGAL